MTTRAQATLDEARRIANQPIEDRLNGEQGDEARTAILRLMEDAGLDYSEGLRLISAFDWSRWSAGYESGREAGKNSMKTQEA
jgi:hypothetical protein